MEPSNKFESIEKEIEKGLKLKRIEAKIAQIIHEKTKLFEKEICQLLKGRNESFDSISNSSARAKQLSIFSLDLINKLLASLWNSKDIDIVLSCISELSNIKNKWEGYDIDKLKSNKNYVNHNVYYKLITQPFYHSRTLFGIMIAPQILELEYGIKVKKNFLLEKIDYEDNKITQFEMDKIKSSSERLKKYKEYVFTFQSIKEEKINHTVKLRNKSKGGQFGGLFFVTNNKITKSYFAKSYYGYPAKSNFNSELALFASESQKQSSDIINDNTYETTYSEVDFKELFIYKVLELMGLGPKVYFLVNPYLKDGLYIITENLNEENKEFIEISKINYEEFFDVNVSLMKLRKGEYNDNKIYNSYNALVDLLEIDIINRIFTLNDFNADNFGFLKEKENQIESNTSWISSHQEFKIIDFLPSIKNSERYIDKNIKENYVEGNSSTKYSSYTIMHLAIYREIDKSSKIFKGIDIKKLKQKYFEEKLFFGKKVIEKIEKRCGGQLNIVLNDSKEKIINFIKKNQYSIALSNDYLSKGFEDLDLYIDGIIINYNTLKNFLYSQNKNENNLVEDSVTDLDRYINGKCSFEDINGYIDEEKPIQNEIIIALQTSSFYYEKIQIYMKNYVMLMFFIL